MPTKQPLEVTAWRDEEYDLIRVKIRTYTKDVDNKIFKKGVIINISEELLRFIAEGCMYPFVAPLKKDVEAFEETTLKGEEDEGLHRFENIVDDDNTH